MITNDNELREMMVVAVKNAVNSTLEHFKNRLIEIIDESVYSNTPEWYIRTFEFRES